MKRRILALFLSLCMILAMLPAHAFAQTAEPTTGYLSGSYRNPLYSHDECCTAEGRLEAPRTYTDGTLSEEDYLVDDADVLSAICAGLEQRQATITVPWKISRENISAETEQDDIKSFLLAAFLLAMSHTGVPTQGDYLLWVYGEVSYGASYGYDSEYYYLDASYDVTYYTTAEQEAALTAKLETVMASFGFTDATDDYSKVKAIYDYICANVVYDYTNLEDESYTLKYTAYAALMDGTAVCQGYATLFYRMALTAGVDTRVIIGDAGGAHAWNIALLDSLYYNLDSTWDAGQTEYGDGHIDIKHKSQGTKYRQQTGEKLGKSHQQTVRKLLHIGDHAAYQISGGMGIQIRNRKLLNLCNGSIAQVPADTVSNFIVADTKDPLGNRSDRRGSQYHL